MSSTRETLEGQLNHFDTAERRAALDALLEQVAAGAITLPPQDKIFNLHCHTFFSYNGYGYSPTALAWKGRVQGFYAMGLVDFDVLDGVDEFLEACGRLGLRACAGLETRVFVPEFATRVINSPGEPGISYHMGVGFTSGAVRNSALLGRLKDIAQARNRGMVERINPHLQPAALDYDADVLPLTPNGNATERHVCTGYAAKAASLFPDPEARAAFWAERLGVDAGAIRNVLDDAPALQGLIRAKTMKAGGVGYVVPEGPDFPQLAEVSDFVLDNGGIPAFAFLDGASEGEQAMDELLDVMMAAGAAAVNIIPDRNWNIQDAELKRQKVDRLYYFVDLARARHLPIVIGTEMNAPGQRFVDDFEAAELKPLHAIFLQGVHILHAHTVLQAHAGMGYCSTWAKGHFAGAEAKNRFYNAAGAKVGSGAVGLLQGVGPDATPAAIAQALKISI